MARPPQLAISLADSHGVKMSSVPAKPSARPAPRRGVTFRSAPARKATSTVHSGVVALMTPATFESTVRSPIPNRVYGMAFATKAATNRCTHVTSGRDAHAACQRDRRED